jgi:hypothetical protein
MWIGRIEQVMQRHYPVISQPLLRIEQPMRYDFDYKERVDKIDAIAPQCARVLEYHYCLAFGATEAVNLCVLKDIPRENWTYGHNFGPR